MSRVDPLKFRSILYLTEAELFKHKRKLYPNSLNNAGDGYSQYIDPQTRNSILTRIRELYAKKIGLQGNVQNEDDGEHVLEVLENSVKLLKFNYRHIPPEDSKKATIDTHESENEEEKPPVVKKAPVYITMQMIEKQKEAEFENQR